MDALVTKPYSQLRYPQIVHSGLKHKFYISLHSEGIGNAENALNPHFGSTGVEWMVWLRNHFRNFGTPK
jgi:hypothetical protein